MTYDEEQFLIHELADQLGVSTRTIRYYIAEGLLPAPTNRGRYSYYHIEYLDRIRLIKALQTDFLPLREIRLVMDAVKIEEIPALLASEEERRRYYKELRIRSDDPLNQDASSAAGYIQNLITPRVEIREEIRRIQPSALPRRGAQPPASNDPIHPPQSWRQERVIDGVTLSIREDVEIKIGGKLNTIIIALRQMFRLL